ncbi:DnaJ domain containing protein [Lotmaria passim]
MEKYYRVLGLRRGTATEADVKRAYRKNALLVHPDRNPNNGEAFKALQEAYEAVLAEVQRGGGRCNVGTSGGPASSSSSCAFYSAFASAAATSASSAGAAHNYARTFNASHLNAEGPNTCPTPPPPPPPSSSLFTEEELFGDAIPGGWRDVGCAQQRHSPHDGKAGTHFGAGYTRSQRNNAGFFANPAEARWRRAHGNRVPVSAYDGSCPVPPPPPPTSAATRSPSFRSVPPPTAAAGAAARRTTTTTSPHAPSQQQQAPSSTKSTQAQWEAFFAQEHPRRQRPSSPSRDAMAGASSSSSSSSSEGESAEERAYREALFLHRHMEKLSRQGQSSFSTQAQSQSQRSTFAFQGKSGSEPHPLGCSCAAAQPMSPLNRTAAAATAGEAGEVRGKEELYQQWHDVQASLQRKLGGEDHPASPHASSSSSPSSPTSNNTSVVPRTSEQEKGSEFSSSTAAEAATAATFSTSSSPSPAPPAFNLPPRQDNVHRDALLKERRLLQREYLRYRYTPDPAEVGEMSDMEVYLLAELLKNIQSKVQAVLVARLARGPCSACSIAPREVSRRYFACVHRSICAACYDAGVVSCPLCGAARLAPQDEA